MHYYRCSALIFIFWFCIIKFSWHIGENIAVSVALFSAVFPNMCSVSVAAMEDQRERDSRVDFWDSVYG